MRRGRISHPERVYHITFATRNRTPIFHDHVLAIAACRTFARTASSADAELLCWLLMPDHFHGLLQLHGVQGLSRCVQRLKGRDRRLPRSW